MHSIEVDHDTEIAIIKYGNLLHDIIEHTKEGHLNEVKKLEVTQKEMAIEVLHKILGVNW